MFFKKLLYGMLGVLYFEVCAVFGFFLCLCVRPEIVPYMAHVVYFITGLTAICAVLYGVSYRSYAKGFTNGEKAGKEQGLHEGLNIGKHLGYEAGITAAISQTPKPKSSRYGLAA